MCDRHQCPTRLRRFVARALTALLALGLAQTLFAITVSGTITYNGSGLQNVLVTVGSLSDKVPLAKVPLAQVS